jgi:murein DD-endopeptidase MepM/ murein hydrolase activator NlpD
MNKTMLIIFAATISLCSGDSSANNNYNKHKDAVIKQHKQDLKNRDAILAALGAFLNDTSRSFTNGSIKIDTPVSTADITDIKDTDHIHYSGVIPPKIYGYVTTDSLNIRAEDNGKSEIIGKLKFREKVEIVFQSDSVEEIKGIKSPWLLVRKTNGDEGWVFGGYVSDNVPSEKDKDSGKTDWGMIMPADGRISSRFGKRVDPITKRRGADHKGIDIAAPIGTPVYASADGTVTRMEFVKNGYGNLIVIKHADDLATYYGHLSKFQTGRGAKVRKGELIGNVGSTGKSTGPHLHFEVRRGDKALDPEGFVR